MQDMDQIPQGAEADQQDAFLSGWEEPDRGAEEPKTQTAPEPAPEQGAETAETTPAEVETTTEEPKSEEQESGEAPDGGPKTAASWTVKHMGREMTMSETDITPELLQKGLDYDRVREKYDEAKPVIAMFSEFAQRAGMSTADYVKYIRSEAKKAGGMSAEEAKRAVDLEDREAAVAAKEQEQQEETDARARSEARVKADLSEFERAFPQIYEQAKRDPAAIPQSVWDDVNKGMSLTAAYSRFAVAQANEMVKAAQDGAAAAETNLRNAVRSTGSLKSAGMDTKSSDPFLDGFDG